MHDKFFEAGRLWQLGPDWPGQRCGAKTRSGAPCKNPAVAGRQRCRMHGGRSTTAAKAEAKRRTAVGRAVRAELRDIERGAIATGLLAKDWRSLWDIG